MITADTPPAPAPALVLSRDEHACQVRRLSDRLVALHRPLAVLRAVRWGDEVEQRFFACGCRALPEVTRATYHRPLGFDPNSQDRLLAELERDVRARLGTRDPAGQLLADRIRQARDTIELLRHRGTPAFAGLSQRLYLGNGPAPQLDGLVAWLRRLAEQMEESAEPPEDKALDAAEATVILGRRLDAYFRDGPAVRVAVRPGLSADAAAEGGCLKLRAGGRFSPRDLQLLEVHEGWVHLGTTRAGQGQAACTFLGRAFPGCTPTQEGLAVLAELAAGVSYPARLRRLAARIDAVRHAAAGADFLEVFRCLLDLGQTPGESYQQAARVFRGSLPSAGPFAKDLAYGVGMVQVARFLARADDQAARLLWCGKTALADVEPLAQLAQAGLVRVPDRVPFTPREAGGIAAALAEL